MKNYESIIARINTGINAFNQHLNSSRSVPLLDPISGNSFMNISETPWEEQFWPNKDANGVYFLFGYKESEPHVLVVYIGKASFAKIGERLYCHLSRSRNEPHYRLNDASGSPCIIEMVASIDLSTGHNPAFATALEEFLITETKSDIHLINAVGNT